MGNDTDRNVDTCAAGDTYAAGRRVLDADAHIMEPLGWLESFAPAAVRDRIPSMDLGDQGMVERIAEAEATKERRDADPVEAAAARDEMMTMPRKGFRAFGSWDTAERTEALDLLGFEAQLVFPTTSFPQALASPADVLLDAIEAMNRGLVAFCDDDARLLSVAYVPMQRGVDDARRVLATAVREGADTIAVDAVPAIGSKSPTHPEFDSFWAEVVDHDLAVMLHVGLDNGWRPVRPEFFDNGRELPHWRSDAPGDALSFLAIGDPARLFIGAMIFDGVLSRHPGLRIGVAELGATWVPGLLRFLDTAHRSFRRQQDLTHLEADPSDYVRRHFCFSPFAGEDVGFMIEAGGEELFMFSSDYPHHEGSDDPIRRFDRTMTNVSPEAVDAYYHGNFARLLGDRLPVGARP